MLELDLGSKWWKTLSLDLHEDVFAFDRNCKRFLADAIVEAVLASGDVVLPAVPRAGHDAAFDDAFGDWSTRMRADAVDRMELTIEIEQRHHAPSSDKLLACARWDVVNTRDANSFAHEVRVLSGLMADESSQGVKCQTVPTKFVGKLPQAC